VNQINERPSINRISICCCSKWPALKHYFEQHDDFQTVPEQHHSSLYNPCCGLNKITICVVAQARRPLMKCQDLGSKLQLNHLRTTHLMSNSSSEKKNIWIWTIMTYW